jgi:uncharacterized repeat protein (TIGR01451 family)
MQKISTDLTGDPAVLLAGETLRYTLTLRNIGNDDAVDAVLRDAIPVNTTYVSGSTTLNGSPLADVSGLSPLALTQKLSDDDVCLREGDEEVLELYREGKPYRRNRDVGP